MLYTMDIKSFNGRRYGRPWAAKITAFNGAATLAFEKSPYNGDDSGGELVIEAQAGEIIKLGQKDHRSNNSWNEFYFCNFDGSLNLIDDPKTARQKWTEHHQKTA